MNNFPSTVQPLNRKIFPDLLFNLRLAKLRQQLTEHVYSETKTGFNLVDKNNKVIPKPYIEAIINELTTLGWKTKLSHGDTLLYIYEKEDELPQWMLESCELEPLDNNQPYHD